MSNRLRIRLCISDRLTVDMLLRTYEVTLLLDVSRFSWPFLYDKFIVRLNNDWRCNFRPLIPLPPFRFLLKPLDIPRSFCSSLFLLFFSILFSTFPVCHGTLHKLDSSSFSKPYVSSPRLDGFLGMERWPSRERDYCHSFQVQCAQTNERETKDRFLVFSSFLLLIFNVRRGVGR